MLISFRSFTALKAVLPSLRESELDGGVNFVSSAAAVKGYRLPPGEKRL